MEKFEKWKKDNGQQMREDFIAFGALSIQRWIEKAWQESAKQKEFDATVERLKGFQKGLSKGISGERERIIKWLRDESDELTDKIDPYKIHVARYYENIADRIERDHDI